MADPNTTMNVAQTVLGSLIVQLSTGAVMAVAAVAYIVRMFRRDLRDANLDKVSDGIIATQAADIKSLRERLDAIELSRDKLREDLANLHADFTMLQRENAALREENRRLHDDVAAARAEAASTTTELYRLQMQCSGQLKTIEDLQLKVRNLEAVNTKASLAGRRKGDPSDKDSPP